MELLEAQRVFEDVFDALAFCMIVYFALTASSLEPSSVAKLAVVHVKEVDELGFSLVLRDTLVYANSHIS